MTDINSRTDFEQWIRQVSRNNLRRDGSDADFVANIVVTSLLKVGDALAVQTNPAPYADSPIDPSTVIRYAPDVYFGEHYTHLHDEDWRDFAVEIVANEIEKTMGEIEADRADHRALQKAERRRERHFDRHGHF